MNEQTVSIYEELGDWFIGEGTEKAFTIEQLAEVIFELRKARSKNPDKYSEKVTESIVTSVIYEIRTYLEEVHKMTVILIRSSRSASKMYKLANEQEGHILGEKSIRTWLKSQTRAERRTRLMKKKYMSETMRRLLPEFGEQLTRIGVLREKLLLPAPPQES